MTNKTESIRFRCTPKQKEIIESKAEAAGLDVSAYCRTVALLAGISILEDRTYPIEYIERDSP